jgi:hypothetical protein
MSSRLIPPRVGARSSQKRMISSGSLLSTSMHRLAGHRTDVAETEDGGAVGDHRDQVAFVSVLVDQLGIAGDLEARLGDPGGVGKRKVALGDARFGGHHLGLAVSFAGVVGESLFLRDLFHGWAPLLSTESQD